eukprot:CAMPEP_0171906456 /NCGR_PEP_ID=MMETSP0993-20121228/6097_1 /TAXON_ID=483369 /ORGANISM="non described non described, Strain CCMP2098" /LENGTH=448 /DNA_ID=CAMNT_0012538335 /DNA_START=25 /DNA_END=1371 /DNA_ORIENTATION=-
MADEPGYVAPSAETVVEVGTDGADISGTPPAPPAAPFVFNFGPPAAVAGATSGLGALKLGEGVKLKDGDDDDEDDSEDDDDEDDEDEDAEAALAAVMGQMPAPVLARVLRLKGLDTERDEIFKDYEKERKALELKYQELYAPLYASRKDVVTGLTEVEIPADLAGSEIADQGADAIVGIPKFWLQAMARRAAIAQMIEEADVDCLGHLVDVRCRDNADMDSFTIEFEFKANPFFSNQVLTKVYTVETLLGEDEPTLEKVTGTEIEWKTGKCLTHKEVQKKQRAKKGKNKGQVRTVTEKSKVASFFHFFSPPDVEKLQECEDPEEAEELMTQFNMDYGVAQLLRLEVVPCAVLCFTGEMQDSDEEDSDDEDDEEDSDEDDEDSEDDADSDEDVGGKGGRKNKGGKGGGGKGQGKGGGKKKKGGGGGGIPALPGGGKGKGEGGDQECKQS